VNALVAFIPTSQSASVLASPALPRLSNSLPSLKDLNPFDISSSVKAFNHNLFVLIDEFESLYMNLKISSPSLPASQALTINS